MLAKKTLLTFWSGVQVVSWQRWWIVLLSRLHCKAICGKTVGGLHSALLAPAGYLSPHSSLQTSAWMNECCFIQLTTNISLKEGMVIFSKMYIELNWVELSWFQLISIDLNWLRSAVGRHCFLAIHTDLGVSLYQEVTAQSGMGLRFESPFFEPPNRFTTLFGAVTSARDVRSSRACLKRAVLLRGCSSPVCPIGFRSFTGRCGVAPACVAPSLEPLAGPGDHHDVNLQLNRTKPSHTPTGCF